MSDEELNKMIGEFLPYPAEGQHYALKQFAKLVAAAEREACAKLCESRRADKENDPSYSVGWFRTKKHNDELAAMISARGQE